MATEFTPHYNLDKYTAQDKPNLRDQYNAAMDKIDLALLSANTNATEAKSATQGFQEQLNTKASKTEVAEDIADAIAPLATKTELNNAVSPLATKTEVNNAIGNAVAPLATKTELNNAVSPLATKTELNNAVTPLATKTALQSEVTNRTNADTVLDNRIKILEQKPRYNIVGLRYTNSRMIFMGSNDYDNFVDIGEPFGTLDNEGNAKYIKEIGDTLYIFNDSRIYYTKDFKNFTDYNRSEIIGTVPSGYWCWALNAFEYNNKVYAICAYGNNTIDVTSWVGTTKNFEIRYHECYINNGKIKCDTPVSQWSSLSLIGNSHIDPDITIYNGRVYLACKNEITCKIEIYTNASFAQNGWTKINFNINGYGLEAPKLVNTGNSLICFVEGYNFTPDSVPHYTAAIPRRPCIILFSLAYFTVMENDSICNALLPYHACRVVSPTAHNALIRLTNSNLIKALNDVNECNISTMFSLKESYSYWDAKAGMNTYTFTNFPNMTLYQQAQDIGGDITLRYEPLFDNGCTNLSFQFIWANSTTTYKAGSGFYIRGELENHEVVLDKTAFHTNNFSVGNEFCYANVVY